jgi:hypothetical protein
VKPHRSTNEKRATISSDASRLAKLGKEIWNGDAGIRAWKAPL